MNTLLYNNALILTTSIGCLQTCIQDLYIKKQVNAFTLVDFCIFASFNITRISGK